MSDLPPAAVGDKLDAKLPDKPSGDQMVKEIRNG